MNNIEYYMNLFGWRHGSSSVEGLYFAATIMLQHEVSRVSRSELKKLGGFTRLPGCLSGQNPTAIYSQNACNQSPILEVMTVTREGREYIYELNREAISERVMGKLYWYTKLLYGRDLPIPDGDRPLLNMARSGEQDLRRVFVRLGETHATQALCTPGAVLLKQGEDIPAVLSRYSQTSFRFVAVSAQQHGGHRTMSTLFQEIFYKAITDDWQEHRMNGHRWDIVRDSITVDTFMGLSSPDKVRALLLWELVWQFHRHSIFPIHDVYLSDEDKAALIQIMPRLIDPAGGHTISRVIEMTLQRCRGTE